MISPFGVDHGYEVSKIYDIAIPVAHGMVAGKKGKKGRAVGNELGGTIAGEIAGAATGAALTRSVPGAMAGAIAGGVGGGLLGYNRNKKRGYLKGTTAQKGYR
jgi:hypothetical protein